MNRGVDIQAFSPMTQLNYGRIMNRLIPKIDEKNVAYLFDPVSEQRIYGPSSGEVEFEVLDMALMLTYGIGLVWTDLA